MSYIFGLVLTLIDHTHKLVQYDEKGFKANCLHASGRLGLGGGERDMVSFCDVIVLILYCTQKNQYIVDPSGYPLFLNGQ